jgi:hypothetical protein
VQRFEKEAFGGFAIACRTQEQLERVAKGSDCPLEIPPGFLQLHLGLIHSPSIMAGLEMRPRAFVELWGRVLHPAEDRGVIDPESALTPHLLQVTGAECIPQVPTHAQQKDLGLLLTPVEWGGSVQDADSSPSRE